MTSEKRNLKTMCETRKNVIIITAGTLFAALVLVLSAGCADLSKVEYYENGQVKSVTTDKSFDPRWSSGPGKQLPGSNITVSGASASLPSLGL